MRCRISSVEQPHRGLVLPGDLGTGLTRSIRIGEDEMASLEQVEISRYHEELVHDVRHLVKKYGRIMGWEVPELDEAEASKLILAALKQALADVEREQP
jgi:hypothetical protein